MSINSLAVNNRYNHYLTSYTTKKSTIQDSHKKSELRAVYNNIIKMNKVSPLFQTDTSNATKEFAIGMKESARELMNSVASLNGSTNQDFLGKKKVYSSNNNIASVSKNENVSGAEEDSSFELGVDKLATPQVNLGELLPDRKNTLSPGEYSFDLNIHNKTYEFQFPISQGETNKSIQDRIARLITNSKVGVKAEIITDSEGNNALKIQSLETGLDADKTAIFSISGSNTTTPQAVSYLGIGQVLRPATNASFTIDGEAHSSTSNTFSLDQNYEITLNGIGATPDDTTHIGYKTDIDSLSDNIMQMFSSYNNFILSTSELASKQPRTKFLVNDFNKISNHYQTELNSIGLGIENNGTISVHKDALSKAVAVDTTNNLFGPIKGFAEDIIKKAKQVSLNPMEYAERKLYAYQNPNKQTAVPYITSAYTGMMFNGYC